MQRYRAGRGSWVRPKFMADSTCAFSFNFKELSKNQVQGEVLKTQKEVLLLFPVKQTAQISYILLLYLQYCTDGTTISQIYLSISHEVVPSRTLGRPKSQPSTCFCTIHQYHLTNVNRNNLETVLLLLSN